MLRQPLFRPQQCFRLPSTLLPSFCIRQRISFLHTTTIRNPEKPLIPQPRRDIPNVKAFLERIGRNADKECEDKITTWSGLFRSTGQTLKKKEIPARLRRYILMQVEKYRNGEEIVHIKRGRKLAGGERRRNVGPTKSKIGR